MTRNRKIIPHCSLIAAILSLLLCLPPSGSAAGGASNLQHDLAYYRKISAQKNLNANDRYYILLRISAKYDGTPVDLAPLKAEIKSLGIASPETYSPQNSTPPSAPPRHQVSRPAPATPALATPAVPSAGSYTASASSDSYTIDTGDILSVAVYPTEELSRDVVVQKDGSITMPLAGAVPARGLTTRRLERSIARALGKYVANPQVTITVKQFNRHQLLITGEVRSVGAFDYRENMRLMEFISAAGGFTDAANRREIKVFRGSPASRQVHIVDVEALIRSGDFSRDFVLQPGDIIEVPKGKSRISILGDVHAPGYFDFQEHMRLADLMSQAGGFKETANIKAVTIIRADGTEQGRTEKVNLKKILSGKQKDVTLNSGDTVYVPRRALASSNLFTNSVLPWLTLLSLVVIISGG